MNHVSYTELRSNLAGFMDKVCDSRAPLLVTRQNARSVVMISEDEYRGADGNRPSPAESRPILLACSSQIQEANKSELTEHELVEPTASVLSK